MARKTSIAEEIEERADYFADWIKRLSDERDEAQVVNNRTAAEFIKNALSRDTGGLSNLAEGMEKTGKGMNTLIKTSYIQTLIDANILGKKLDVAVSKLRKKRQSLEQLIPKKKVATRKAVINKFTSAQVLRKYDVAKNKNGRYYNPKNGRFVGFDRILKITDATILNTAKKRRDLEKFMAGLEKKRR